MGTCSCSEQFYHQESYEAIRLYSPQPQHPASLLPESIWRCGCLPGRSVNGSEEGMSIGSQHVGFVPLVLITARVSSAVFRSGS